MFNTPFSPITGQGLGLGYSSKAQVGDILPSRKFGQANLQIYTNVTNGNLFVRDHHVKVMQMPMPLELGFVYNSLTKRNWRLSLQKQFIFLPDPNNPQIISPVLYEEDGHITAYTYNPQLDLYSPPACANGTPYFRLDVSGKNWIWYHPGTEITEIYDADGFLSSRTDREGRTFNFQYNKDHELTYIITPSGIVYKIVKQYLESDSNNDKDLGDHTVSFYEVKDGNVTLLQTSYFDIVNNLLKTVTPQGYEINYEYAENLITTINQSDQTSMAFAYDTNNRVNILKAGDNLFNRIDYSTPGVAVISDSMKIKTQIVLDDNGRVSQVIRERGYASPTQIYDMTSYAYSDAGQLASVTHPDLGKTTFAFDPTYGFKTQIIQPDGQKKEFYYEPGTDQPRLFTEVRYLNDSNPIVTRYVYDENVLGTGECFLRFKISPEGRVTEYRPDKWNNVASIRLYPDATIDVSQMDKTISPSLYQMEEWVASQNPQTACLTEFDYDESGQLNCTRKYAHLDANGNGIADQWMAQEYTVHDRYGNVLLKQSRQSNTVTTNTVQSFDDLQRLTQLINPLQEQTQLQYNDTQSQIQQVLPNGRVKVQQNNSCGLIDSITETAVCNGILQTRVTGYQCDSDYRPVITTQPDGQEQITFYDRQQRLGFSISPQGKLTQYQYDLQNHYKKTITYATAVNVADLYAITPPYPGELPSVEKLQNLITEIQNEKLDRINYECYDLSGRTKYEIKSNLAVVETLYDNLNRKIGQITYSTPILRNQINALEHGQTLNLLYNPLKDSAELTFYDNDNKVVGKVDAAGYFTQFKFDAAGRCVEKILHNQPLPLAEIIKNKSFSLEAVKPATSLKDTHTYYYYNSANKCIAEVDNAGHYIEHTYLASGLTDKTIAYATQLDEAVRVTLSSKILPKKPLPSPEDQITSYTYDKLNRIINQTEPFNKMTTTAFDKVGDVTIKKISDALISENVDPHYLDTLQQALEKSPIASELKTHLHTLLSQIELPTLQGLDPDHMRAAQNNYDGWSQVTAEINGYATQLLAIVEASDLSEQEKTAIAKQIWQQLSTRHHYDQSGLKLSSTDVFGNITYFYYNADRKLCVVVNPKGSIKEFTRNTFNEIISTRAYANVFTTQEYTQLTGGFISADFQTILNDKQDDERDAITVQARNNAGLVESVLDPEGYLTKDNYTLRGQLATEIIPVADKTPSLIIEHDFDPRGLEKETRKISNTLTTKKTRHYDNPYGKVTAIIDEIERESKTEYNPLGLAKKEIDPEQVVRQTKKYDAFNRLTTQTDSLQHTEHHYYNQANRTHTIQKPDGTEETFQVNVFDEKISYKDELGNVSLWRHDPHGKITQHVDALQQTTQDGYDLKGRQIRHTDANGVVTDFSYDNADNLIDKIFDINGLKLKTHYIPDAWGRNSVITDPNFVETKQVFDRRNLLTQSIIDPIGVDYLGLNLTTSKTYNGQKTEVGKQEGNNQNTHQYEEAYLQDELNRAVGKIIDPKTSENPNALAITNKTILDKAGQVVATQDPNGNMTYTFYDKCGRERFIISPLSNDGDQRWGSVTEKRYDTEDHVIYSSKYKQPLNYTDINQNTPLSLMEMIAEKVRSSSDSQLWSFYDVNGREQFTVNSLGAVEGKNYDKASRVIKNSRYAKSIDPKLLPELNIKQLTNLIEHNQGLDRITYTLRDELGRARFVIDPKGYVLEQRYDQLGQIICKKIYANPVKDAAKLATLSPEEFSQQLILDSVNDRVVYNAFDSRGKPTFTIDGEGAVTRYDHDNNGNLTDICKFATKIKVPNDYQELLNLVQDLIPNSTTDRITKNKYNTANQLIETTNPEEYIEYFKLNALGKVEKHTDFGGSDWQYSYDRAKRKKTEATPETAITCVYYNEQSGKLEFRQDTVSVTKELQYDNINNVIRSVDGAEGEQWKEERNISHEFFANKQIKQSIVPEVAVDDVNKPADFAQRPEQTQDITVGHIYDAKGNELVTRDEVGNNQFKIYDSENRLIFTIDAKGGVVEKRRNSFGEVEHKIKYANSLKLDLSQYKTTGLPLDVLQANLQSNGKEDRQTFYYYDLRGDLETRTKGPIFFYTPAISGNDSPTYAVGYAVTKRQYNATRQCVYQGKLINPKLHAWTEEWRWFDRNGKNLAYAKKINKLDQAAPTYFIKRKYLNAFGEIENQIEFATPQILTIDSTTSLQYIDENTVSSPNDRTKIITYNRLGRPASETRCNVTIQKVGLDDKGCPYMYDEVVDKLTRYFEYAPIKTTGPTVVTYEDGSKSRFFYDKRGFLIAKTGVPFTSEDENGNKITLIALTQYGINSFGQRVMEVNYALGAKAADVPSPVEESESDQYTLTQFNKLGKPIFKQDAEENLTAVTYTATRLPAREFGYLTNWVPLDPGNGQYTTIKNMDETRIIYDANKKEQKITLFRDNKFNQTTENVYNSFNEIIGEGKGDGTFPKQQKFDASGNPWLSNFDKGIWTVKLYDLLKKETAQLRSATDDLSTINPSDIPAILQWDISRLEKTESLRDAASRQSQKLLPAYPDTGNDESEFIPLSMVTGNTYAHFGTTSITWALPEERIVEPRFYLWPLNKSENKKAYPIYTTEQRCGVDVSFEKTGLCSDIYQYEIDYFFTDPATGETIQLYTTTGTLQFDNGNNQNSAALVAIVEHENQLILSGNNAGLTAIELWQDNEKVAQVPVQAIGNTANFLADLSDFASGNYLAKPVINNQPVDQFTLPFSIFSTVPSTKPMAREISCEIILSILDKYGELLCLLPPDFAQQPIKVECVYMTEFDRPNYFAETITPGQSLGEYNGFTYNMLFPVGVKSIVTLSAYMQTPDSEWLPLQIANAPLNQKNIKAVSKEQAKKAKPKLAITYQGKVKDQNTFTYFSDKAPATKLEDVMALGVTREQFIRKLLSADGKTKAQFAKEMATEIKNAFFNRQCTPPDRHWMYLSKNYFEAKLDLEQAIQKAAARKRRDDYIKADADEIIQDLQLKGRHVEADELLQRQLQFAEIENEVNAYCGKIEVYEHYIKNLSKHLLLNPTCLKQYASLINISYSIWQSTNDNPFHLVLLEANQTKNPVSEIHLLKKGEVYCVLTQHSPINTNLQLTCKRNASLKEEINEDIDWQMSPTYDETKERESQKVKANTVVVNRFPNHLLLAVSPLVDVTSITAVSYLDTSLGNYAKQRNLNVLGYTHTSLIVEVTGILPGVYPCKVGTETTYSDLSFTLTQGGSVYCSDEFPSQRKKQITDNKDLPPIHPIYNYDHDVWNNIVGEQDPEGFVTTREFNDSNKLIKLLEPEITVFDAQGGTHRERPETRLGYNCNGISIGKTNANKNTEINELDEANHVIKMILGDGTVSRRQIVNALGQVVHYFDARNKKWLQQFNRLNLLVKQITPTNKVTQRYYNEKRKVNLVLDPINAATRYNFSVLGLVEKRWDPMGQCTITTSDRNGLPTEQQNPDGTIATWDRDYHGNPTEHTDLNGTQIKYIYDKKMQLIDEQGSGLSHGATLEFKTWTIFIYNNYSPWNSYTTTAYQSYPTLIPDKHLSRVFVAGRLMQVSDSATGKTTFYDYNKKNQRNVLQVIQKDGSILRKVKTYLDGLGREFYTYDTQMLMIVGLDAVGNRRCVTSKIYTDYNTVLELQQYNTFDKAERILIDSGVLDPDTKQIVLTPTQGFENSYLQGLRGTQKDGTGIIIEFGYDDDSLLISTISSTGEITTRQYNAQGWQWDYADPRVEIRTDCNANAWQTYQLQKQDGQNQTLVNSQLTNTGEVDTQQIYYFTKDSKGNSITITDSMHNEYLRFDNLVLSTVGASRTVPNVGTSPYSSVTQYFGPNAELVVLGNNNVDLSTNSKPIYTYAQSTYDNLTLEKIFLFQSGHWEDIDDNPAWIADDFLIAEQITREFYTINGDYLGSYSYYPAEKTLTGSLNYRFYFGNTKGQTYPVGFNSKLSGWQVTGPRRDVFTVADSTSPFINPYTPAGLKYPPIVVQIMKDAGYNLTNPTTPPDEVIPTFPPAVANSYVTSDGDTFEGISQKELQTPSMADAIRVANGYAPGSQPQPGFRLRIPQFIPQTDTNLDFYSKEALMSQIMGQLYPALQTPQPRPPHVHHSFFSEVVSFFVDAVAIAVGTALLPGVGTGMAMAIAAATAAVIDTAAQFAEVELGLEPKFNWREVFDVSLQAALSVFDAPLQLNPVLNVALMGLQNAGEQLADIAIGATHKFDVKSFLASMAEAELDNKVDFVAKPGEQLSFGKITFNNVFNNASGGVIGQLAETEGKRFNLEAFAAEFIGTTLGDEVGARLVNEAEEVGKKLASYIDALTGAVTPQTALSDDTTSTSSSDNTSSSSNNNTSKTSSKTSASTSTNTSTRKTTNVAPQTSGGLDANNYVDEFADDPTLDSPVDWFATQTSQSSNNVSSNSTTNTNTNANNNRAQRWNAQQQNQTYANSTSSFWNSVKNESVDALTSFGEWTGAIVDKTNSILKPRLSRYQSLSRNTESAAESLQKEVAVLSAMQYSNEDAAALSIAKSMMGEFYGLSAKYQLYSWGTVGLGYVGKLFTALSIANAINEVRKAQDGQKVKVAFEQATELGVEYAGTVGINFAIDTETFGLGAVVAVGASVAAVGVEKEIGRNSADYVYDKTITGLDYIDSTLNLSK